MPHARRSKILRPVIAAFAFASLAAFAQGPAPAPASTPTINPPQQPIPPAGAPAAAPASTSQLKSFKETVKEAKEAPGFLTVYEKDEKAWIAIKPDQFEKPFFFSTVRTQGLGERQVISGLMGARHVVYFKKIGNHVQLIAQNLLFRAKEGTAVARAVKSSYSDSLLASAPVVSQPHPDTHAVLIEANALLLSDIPAASTQLETAFHLPYALDARNSSLVKAKASEGDTSFEVSLHFAVPKLPAPPQDGSTQRSNAPRNTPDARSLFLGYYYNLAPLPAPMRPRMADERVGYFTTSFTDYSDDLQPNPSVHYVNRWRLEKKDPSAALSEPVKPIVYWIDRNIPEKYRQAVVDGILEWNKAFERIGFKDAIQAKLQPENADFDTEDVRHASVRWYLSSDGGPAIGPSHSDPRTGEILDADIVMTDVFPRSSRRFFVEDAPKSKADTLALPAVMNGADAFCNFAEASFGEAEFALDLLEARGDLDPGSPEADAFVASYVKEVITHEVGHTLGLRHNFRASTVYTAEQIRDKAFTEKNGIVGSVMDYAPFNLPVAGESRSDYVMPTIGPYDYWAIEYAYKPLDPAQEKDALERIAERGAKEPWLAYGTDEDSFIGGAPQGMDPTVNVWDLSDNPLAYYRKRLELSRELWDRLQKRSLARGDSYDALRRSFVAGFTQLSRGLTPATKYIGGVVQVRDRAGSGRMPFTPVPAAQQREALKILADGAFSFESFRFRPEFLASLPPNRLDYFDNLSRGNAGTGSPMVSVPATILDMQKTVLDQVMSDAVATRIVETQTLAASPKESFQLSELYDTLQASIWSELKSGRDITPMRRNLQREHLRRVAGILLRPSAGLPADARSLQRMNAQALAAELKSAQAKPGLSKETRAHLAESFDTLTEALRAPMLRAGA
jgi:Met-zincin/Domain of unknown function (DUF5117)